MSILITYLLYPGLLTLLLLSVFFALLQERRLPRLSLPAPRSAEAIVAYASILLSALAVTLLPWPWHPVPSWIGNPLLLLVVIEGAFWLPLLPALRVANPLVTRAAGREWQISLAGRFVCWLLIGSTLWNYDRGSIGIPGFLMLLVAAVLTFPAAAGVGPFGPERALTSGGSEDGLDENIASMLRFARTVRSTMLLTVVLVPLVALLPARPVLTLIIVLAAFVAAGLALRQFTQGMPRTTALNALSWCFQRALPLGILGLMYLSVISG